MSGRKLSNKPKNVRRRAQRKISNAEKQLAGIQDKNSIQAMRLKQNIRTWNETVEASYMYDRNTGKRKADYSPEKRQAAFERLSDIDITARAFASPAQNRKITKATQIELNKASIGAPSKYSKAQQQIFYQRSKNLWQGAPTVKDRNAWIVKNGGFNNLQEAVDFYLDDTASNVINAYDIVLNANAVDENGDPLYSEEEIEEARRELYDNADDYQVSPPTTGNAQNIPDRPVSSL